MTCFQKGNWEGTSGKGMFDAAYRKALYCFIIDNTSNEIIKSFQTFDSKYKQENEINIADDFLISPQVVKHKLRLLKVF